MMNERKVHFIEEVKIRVILDAEMEKQLKQYIYELTLNSIEQAKRSVSLDKDFLKKGKMAEWLGISFNTLSQWEIKGCPSCIIGGIQLFSKKEVSEWVLSHKN